MLHIALLRAWTLATFVAIDLLLKLKGCGWVYLNLVVSRRAARGRTADSTDTAASETLRAVQWATKYYYRSRLDCLPRAIALQYLLKARGIPASFCMGVKRFPFAGHTWVEVHGRALDPTPSVLTRYTRVSTIEG